ncbi:hypothetical protein GYB22_11925 [bacterium]|nr:hypothetical protein [bacterium]
MEEKMVNAGSIIIAQVIEKDRNFRTTKNTYIGTLKKDWIYSYPRQANCVFEYYYDVNTSKIEKDSYVPTEWIVEFRYLEEC